MIRDECVLFTGSLYRNGYGQKWSGIACISTTAHRAAWIEKYGLIPDDIEVMHLCDVLYAPGDITYRQCVNIDHLCLGSHQDNMNHLSEQGRGSVPKPKVSGELNGNARLHEEDITAIRIRYKPYDRKNGVSAIARDYGTSPSTISSIVRRETWTHV